MVDQLRASGLSVGSVSSNRTIVEATGPISAVEAAFSVTISDWHDRDQNRDFFGNDTEPTLPAAVASYVVGVAGLNNHYSVHRLGPAPKVGGGPAGGYTPNELKKAYDVTPLASAGYNGGGQPLGLFELDGFRQSNITTYDTQYGLGSPAPAKVLTNGGPGPLGGGEIEVELDIEVMHAIAPASPITVWEGPNTDPGVNATYNAMVTSNTTKSNSTSWGICEPQTTQAEMTTLDNIFKQAAAQGQTFFAASGDYGAYDCGDSTLTVDSPANDPYITGSGGTALTLNADGTYKSELAWSNPSTFPATGGGGGLSSYFAMPSWQTGPGVSNTYSNGKRQVPDISLDSDPRTGYSVFVTYNGSTGWNIVGGTSAAAPSWAALTSLYNQYAAARGKPNLGFANPTIYSTGSNAQPYPPYHDVTTGDNLHYSATVNWDYPTGWGSYDAYNFARDLAGTLPYSQSPQGNWIGNFGANGFGLLGWNGTSDLVSLPQSTLVVDQGSRWQWTTTAPGDIRDLQSPDGAGRRATSLFDASQLRLHLTFSAAYSGNLELYALDWENAGRRENITVNDGSGPRVANIIADLNQGAWVTVLITVASGAIVTITVDRTAGINAVLSGLFLGGAPAPLTYAQSPQGNWIANYGANGSALLGWNGGSDLVSLPQSTLVVDQGYRWQWTRAAPGDIRDLQSPDGVGRRATTLFDASQLRLHLTFSAAYSGNLELYALDWENAGRRENITVNDGSGPRLANIKTDFSQGEWVTAIINVANGGTVTLTIDRVAGSNAVLSGLLLGGAATPLSHSQPPQGDWIGNYGASGYALLGWTGTGDLTSLAQSTLVVDQGARWQWTTTGGADIRDLRSPDGVGRRATCLFEANQLRLHVSFSAAYTGNLELYALDWENAGRRENITVNDGSGPRLANINTDFSQGAWVTAPINVANGGTVTITIDRVAGSNAVLSGLFLG